MTKQKILEITSYGDIFPNNISKAKIKYKELAKIWHPDVDGGDKNVFSHLTLLYNEAIKDIESGKFKASNYIEIKTLNKTIQIHFLTSFSFDFGTCYVCNNHIIYVFNIGTEKFFNNAINMINSIKYQDKQMENTFKRFMPQVYTTYQTIEGNNVIVLRTEKTIYPLKYIYNYYNNKISPKHVAWMITRLSSISCFLQTLNIVNNGLSLDNIFVEPSTHSVYVYGGWWYSGIVNEKMIGVNVDIYDIMPINIKNSKNYGIETDLESIKLLARTLLGEKNPRLIRNNNEIPKEFITFITDGSGQNAIEEYQKWDRLLDASYGAREFIKMELNNKQIYKN